MRIAERSIRWRQAAAFTMTEVVVSLLVLGIMLVSLYAAFSSGFAVVKLARENSRATQIIVQRLEDLRLYWWNDYTNSTVFKTNFTDFYNPSGTNSGTAGTTYQGVISLATPSGVPAAYVNRMRSVTVSLYWTNYSQKPLSNIVVHQRQMQTYVAKYGMQSYTVK